MSIKIICFEPWRGDGITNYDSGFGDRIKYWALAYHLSLIIENIQIIVEDYYWPELLLIDLPNTTSQNIITSGVSRDRLFPLSWEEVSNIISTENNSMLDDMYYYFNFSVHNIGYIFHDQKITYSRIIHNAVSKIKLKLPEASNFMEKEFSDCCCIHLRRGHGTFPTLKFLSEMERFLSKELVKSYWKTFHRSRIGTSIHSKEYKYFDSLIEKDTDTEKKYLPTRKLFMDYGWVNDYKIIPDSDYFNLIQTVILEENSDQKIYISSDIPREYYSYYYDNFPHNIIDKDLYFKKFLSLYKNKLPSKEFKKKYSIPISKVFENVFDLMVGCHSKIVVKSSSNWSKIACLYKKKKIIHADDVLSTNSLGNWIFVDYEIDFLGENLYNILDRWNLLSKNERPTKT
jgi:hypothetical protein